MGRRINEQEARDEAVKYLQPALTLLDQSLEQKAAIHVATALEIIDRATQAGSNDRSAVADAANVSGAGFSIDWGVLVDQHEIENTQIDG